MEMSRVSSFLLSNASYWPSKLQSMTQLFSSLVGTQASKEALGNPFRRDSGRAKQGTHGAVF